MNANNPELARLAELAVERWLEGLGAPQSMEFEMLRARHPTFDIESLEEVAATLRVSLADSPDALPERLRVRLAEGADDYFGPRATPHEGPAVTDLDERSTHRRRSWLAYAGWLAAAASLLLSLTLWVKRPSPAPVMARTVIPPAASTAGQAPVAPSIGASGPQPTNKVPEAKVSNTPRAAIADPATERAQFMKTHAWLLQRSFLPGPDPTGLAVRGDVVWDAKSQTGYMRFRGLRRNDPNVEQYQLWIFDARRDQRFPVDGGVFDIRAATGDQVIRFAAPLNVEVPLMFVVTVERRGGVVVSDRSRIAAVAHTT
jgi:hypothetical protein